MSGAEQRQLFDFMVLDASDTPFSKKVLDIGLKDWFAETNKRYQLKQSADVQLARKALGDVAAFRASLQGASETLKDFLQYSVGYSLAATAYEQCTYVGNEAQDGFVNVLQIDGQQATQETYHITGENSFEYTLVIHYTNQFWRDERNQLQLKRPNPNQFTIHYQIEVSLPDQYDFSDPAAAKITYEVKAYQLEYLDRNAEPLMIAPRSTPIAPREVANQNELDKQFYRFEPGEDRPNIERARHFKPLKDTMSTFLGFFHQAMVYQKPNGKLVFVAQPFEVDQIAGSGGGSQNLKAILDFCNTDKIEAEIIAPVAEKSYPLEKDASSNVLVSAARAFARVVVKALDIKPPVRQHFVTYHYKLDSIGASDIDASGFDHTMTLSGDCYDSQKWSPGVATDAQEKLLEELKLAPDQVTRHYVGVQTNDIDCGYWSTVTAEALLHRGSADLRAHLAKPLTEENMQACKAFALQEKPYNNAIMSLAATLTRATEDEAVESVSPSTSTAGLKNSPSSGVGTGSEPEEEEGVVPQMDGGVKGASSSQSEDDEEPELIVLSAGDAEKAKQIPTDDRATCLVVLGLLSNDLLPASVASVAEDWRLKQDDLKERAARLATTRARYAAIAAEAKAELKVDALIASQAPVESPVSVDVLRAFQTLDSDLEEAAARQTTLQTLAAQLEAQQAEEALRAAAQRQQEEKEREEQAAVEGLRQEQEAETRRQEEQQRKEQETRERVALEQQAERLRLETALAEQTAREEAARKEVRRQAEATERAKRDAIEKQEQAEAKERRQEQLRIEQEANRRREQEEALRKEQEAQRLLEDQARAEQEIREREAREAREHEEALRKEQEERQRVEKLRQEQEVERAAKEAETRRQEQQRLELETREREKALRKEQEERQRVEKLRQEQAEREVATLQEQAKAKALADAKLETFTLQVEQTRKERILAAEEAAKRARAAVNGVFLGIVEARKRANLPGVATSESRAEETAQLKALQARFNKMKTTVTPSMPAPAPSIGMHPILPVTPPQPVPPPAKKPTWFAGWGKRHFAAALGLALLALTIILIPVVVILWRQVLKPSIRKNLINQTAAPQPVVAAMDVAADQEHSVAVLPEPGAPIAPASDRPAERMGRSYSQDDLRLIVAMDAAVEQDFTALAEAVVPIVPASDRPVVKKSLGRSSSQDDLLLKKSQDFRPAPSND